MKQAGAELNALRGHRNHADYDLQHAFRQSIANIDVSIAQRIIQTLRSITPATHRKITDTMKIYERDVLKDVTWHP